MEISIIGAGSLATFILDIMTRSSRFEVIGQYDDRFPEIAGAKGAPVLGRVDDVPPSKALALGIGAPKVRQEIFRRFTARGFTFPAIIDPTCVISSSARIADGVIIGPLSSVLADSEILEGACLMSHVNVNQNVSIGAFALIGAGIVIGNCARIGTGAHLGLGCAVPLGACVAEWSDVARD